MLNPPNASDDMGPTELADPMMKRLVAEYMSETRIPLYSSPRISLRTFAPRDLATR